MRIVAGCDGGGTKCVVSVAVCDDAGTILRSAQATTGPANVRTNPAAALKNIKSATSQAMASAEVPADAKLSELVAALAGAGTEAVQQQWQALLLEHLPAEHITVVADAAILFAAANATGAAVASVIGTGSIAWARDEQGKLTRAGGLGPSVGDEGSAHWIGQQAVLRLRDFSSETEPQQVAQLAPAVFERSEQEDLARQIVAEAAQHLANLLSEATAQIETTPARQLTWICTGGVATHQARHLQDIRQRCETAGVYLSSPIVVQAPVDGAVRLAMTDRR